MCRAYPSGAAQIDVQVRHVTWQHITYRSTHFVANTKIKTALLIHGIIDSRKFWEFGPIVFKGVIKETVIGTAGRRTLSTFKFSSTTSGLKGNKTLSSDTVGFCQVTGQVPRNMVLRFWGFYLTHLLSLLILGELIKHNSGIQECCGGLTHVTTWTHVNCGRAGPNTGAAGLQGIDRIESRTHASTLSPSSARVWPPVTRHLPQGNPTPARTTLEFKAHGFYHRMTL